ncbi:MAG: hypothetical protein ACNYPF_04515, partial [Candidatus Puniceispirillales bacterium WSBS_2018_MAG_OTU23]
MDEERRTFSPLLWNEDIL